LTDTCRDSIGMIYKVENITDGVFGILKKDVLVIGKEGNLKSHKAFANSIKGVLVTQRGECSKMPTTVSLNLICSKQEKGMPYGSILVALFALIGKIRKEKELVLEVANGHENFTALCLYDKFGFQEDLELYDSETCFHSASNVPMRLDLTKVSLQHILDVLARKGVTTFSNSVCEMYSKIATVQGKKNVTQAKRKLTMEINKKKQEATQKANEKLSSKSTKPKIRRSNRVPKIKPPKKIASLKVAMKQTRSISSRRRRT
jgi:hypothetical protein